MSRLAGPRGADDYPDAAQKHLDDAAVLDRGGRPDGCAYLAGYVAECALRTVLLHESSYDERTKQHEPSRLHTARLRVESTHRLEDLFDEAARVSAAVTSRSAAYAPADLLTATIRRWRPSQRYRAPGGMSATESQRMLAEARKIYDRTVGQMRLDGVL